MRESCTNPGQHYAFTCPGCYHNFTDHKAKVCPSCGVSIKCKNTTQPISVCEIVSDDTSDDEDEDEDEDEESEG